MTNPWNGRPPGDAAEQRGWHWLCSRHNEKAVIAVQWVPSSDAWEAGGGSLWTARMLGGSGWRYLGPCLPPADIAALRAERDRLAAELSAFKAAHDIGAPKDGYREMIWREAQAHYEAECGQNCPRLAAAVERAARDE